MSKGILLASGCSYTDPNFKSLDPDVKTFQWPMWPQHVGKSLSLEVINSGLSGNDNLSIHNNIVRDLSKYGNRVKCVCILWSGFDRFRFMHTSTLQLLHQMGRGVIPEFMAHLNDPKNMVTETGVREWLKALATSDYWNPKNLIMGSILDSITYMVSIAEVCETKGIPYIFYQGVQPVNWILLNHIQETIGKPLVKKDEVLKEFIAEPSFRLFQKYKKNIVGFPLFPTLDGECFDHLRWNNTGGTSDMSMKVSALDFHPNGEGQEKLAEIFLEKYYKVYGRP